MIDMRHCVLIPRLSRSPLCQHLKTLIGHGQISSSNLAISTAGHNSRPHALFCIHFADVGRQGSRGLKGQSGVNRCSKPGGWGSYIWRRRAVVEAGSWTQTGYPRCGSRAEPATSGARCWWRYKRRGVLADSQSPSLSLSLP